MRLLNSNKGFILVATLWISAAIILAASFLAMWTNKAVEQTRVSGEELQGEIDVFSTRQILLYLLATRPMTIGGLALPLADQDAEKALAERTNSPLEAFSTETGSELPLDSRIFKGIGKVFFAMQDEGGLLGINNVDTVALDRLLGLLGVPPERRGPLQDKLLDYIDADDLHRLNGAETAQYQAKGLPPPPNRFLLTSWEAKNVLDWGEQNGLWEQNRLPRLTTVVRAGSPNFNTAPFLVLQTQAGLDAETAQRVIAAREQKPFSQLSDINRAAGKALPLDQMNLIFLPTSRLRLTLWRADNSRMQEIHVQLTPHAANHAPWLIDYELTVPMSEEEKSANNHNQEPTAFTIPERPLFTSPLAPWTR